MVTSFPLSLMQTEPGLFLSLLFFSLLILIFVFLPFSEETETHPTWLLKAQHISLLLWNSHGL